MDTDAFSLDPGVEASSPAASLGYDLMFQDYRGVRIGEARPAVEKEHFATETEARQRKAELARFFEPGDFVACVVPTPPPREKTKGRRRR